MVSILNRRNWLTHLSPARRQRRAPAAPRKRTTLRVETLEDRCVPAATATLTNIPTFVGEGPSPIANGNNVEGLGGLSPNAQVGAVESIAIDPTNASHAYIGTVNGGVWVTNNLFASEPTWTPLTDAFQSLAISSVAISPSNTSVIYAGTGSVSSIFGSIVGGQGAGGGAIGLLKSTDGGATWTELSAQVGDTNLNGFRIRDVVPTTQNGGQTVLLGMLDGNGLLRSTNGGLTFTGVAGLPGIGSGLTIDKLVADPTTAGRFYAGVSGFGPGFDGVYVSNNFGASWTRFVDATLQTELNAGEDRVEVAVGPTGDVWAAVLFNGQMQTNGGTESGILRSPPAPAGPAFTAFVAQIDDGSGGGLFPGGQGQLHFSMVADPFNPNVIYVGGDRQPIAPNPFSGTTSFSGRHFLGNIAANTWTTLEGTVGANGTAPHPDSRDMVFAFDPGTGLPTIIESDDGGVYRLSDPEGFVTPLFTAWSSANGNLADTEFYSVSYDSVSHTIFGGAQDNGSPAQNSQGNPRWTSINVGDGTYTAVDNTSMPGFSIRYTTPPGLGGIGTPGSSFLRQVFDANGNPVGAPVALAGKVTNLGNVGLSLVAPLGFVNPYVLNSIDPTRMLVGSSVSGAVFESADRGDDFIAVRGNFISPGGRVSAMAYGGTANGVPNADVALVGTDNAGGGGFFLLLETVAAGPFTPVLAYAAAGGATPSSIVFDPTNWHTVYVTDVTGKVWQGTNVGTPFATFTNITGNLATLITTPTGNNIYLSPAGLGTGPLAPQNVTSVQVVKNGPTTEVLVGAFGGVFRAAPAGAGTTWTEYGTMPHVLVSSLTYNAKDNVLVAGTVGRGAFEIANVTSTAFGAGILNIRENHTDFVSVVHDAANPLLLDVFLDNPGPTPNLQVPLATLSAINVGSLATGDTLTLDNTVDLQAEAALTVSGSSVTGLFFSGNGVGRVQIPVTYSGVNLASLTVNGGSGGNTITVTGSSAAATTINASFAFAANTVDVTGAALDLSGLAGKVTINAGFGADAITFDDSGRTSSDHITVNATSVSSNGAPAGINYNFFSHVTVNTPAVGNSIITVHGTPAFVLTDIFLGGFFNHVTVNVSSSSGYLLHLHSLGGLNTLQALNVSGPVVVKHPNPFEFDFLYALLTPFFTSKIFWDAGFSSATSSPPPS